MQSSQGPGVFGARESSGSSFNAVKPTQALQPSANAAEVPEDRSLFVKACVTVV